MSSIDDWNELIESSAHTHARAVVQRKKPKKKTTKARPEAAIQSAILDYLAMRPDVHAIRINAGKVKTAHNTWFQGAPTGTSDIIGWIIRDGVPVFLAIEVKAGKNKPSAAQKDFIDAVRLAGGVAFVAWSVDDVIEGLNQ